MLAQESTKVLEQPACLGSSVLVSAVFSSRISLVHVPILLRLAARNLWRHPWRSVATAFGVALGIAAVLATLSVGDNVQANVRASLQAAAGNADLIITSGAGGRSVFAWSVLEPMLPVHDGLRFYPVLDYRAEPQQDLEDSRQRRSSGILPGMDFGFQLSGRRTEFPEAVPGALLRGSWPQAGSQAIAVAADYAEQRGLAIGDTVGFATPLGERRFQISGLLDNSRGLASTNAGRVAIVHLEDLQAALRLSDQVSLVEVLQEDSSTLSVPALRDMLLKLGESYTVTLPASSGDVPLGVIDTIQAGLQVLAATLIALAGFMAYNTFAASVVERRHSYALLRTICLTRRQLQRLALLEALLLSMLGVLLGLLLGVALAWAITRVNALLLGFEVRTLLLPWGHTLLAVMVGVVVSLLAAWLPARSASQRHPLSGLQDAQETPVSAARIAWGWLALAAAVLIALLPWQAWWALAASALAMALLFLGVSLATPALLRPSLWLLRPLLQRIYGVAGGLGSSFTLRNASRNGVAIAAVVVGIGITIGVGAMVAGINRAISDWIDSTIVGDMFVSSPVGFPEDFETRVRQALPGITRVSGVGVRIVRFRLADGAQRSVPLILVEAARYHPQDGFGRFQFIQGQGDAERAYQALRQGGEVLVANTLRDRFGIAQGDRLAISGRDGFRELTVAGVVVDFTGGGEALVTGLQELARHGGGQPELYILMAAAGQDHEQLRQGLLETFPELFLDVTLNQDYRRTIRRLSQQTFITTNSLLVLAVIIAALGVANTLGMNLSRRQRELAMLRSLGLNRRGLRQLVSAEGIVVVVVGTVLGIAAGLLLSRVITTGASALTGFIITPVFPWQLLLFALLSSPLIGLLASLLPARRAARLAPVQVLRQNA